MLDFSGYPRLSDSADLPSDVDDVEAQAAGESIREYCGWHIAPSVTETLELDSYGGSVLQLPSLRVVTVSAVTDADDAPIEGYSVSKSTGLLRRDGCLRWPRGYGAVKVTLTHGFDGVPDSLNAVLVAMARDGAAASSAAPNVKQVALDGASITYADAVGVRRGLGAAYGHVLDRYRLL